MVLVVGGIINELEGWEAREQMTGAELISWTLCP